MSQKSQNARTSREQAEIIDGILHGMLAAGEDVGLLHGLPGDFEEGEHKSQYTGLDGIDDWIGNRRMAVTTGYLL